MNCFIEIRVGAVILTPILGDAVSVNNPVIGGDYMLTISTQWYFNAGDVVDVIANQNNNASLGFPLSIGYCFFSMHLMSG